MGNTCPHSQHGPPSLGPGSKAHWLILFLLLFSLFSEQVWGFLVSFFFSFLENFPVNFSYKTFVSGSAGVAPAPKTGAADLPYKGEETEAQLNLSIALSVYVPDHRPGLALLEALAGLFL